MKARIKFLKFGLIFAVALIGLQLFRIQIIEHDKYVEAASSEHMRKFELLAERGQIYMLDGEEVVPVVMNERVWTVFVDPSYVGDTEKVRTMLTEILGKKISVDWDQVFADRKVQYVEVAKGVIWSEIAQVEAANLKGVGKKESTRRVYPNGELASQVLGFINAEGVGYGAEGSLNGTLAGTNGVLKTVADVNNIPLTIGDANIKIPAEDGKEVALAIDITVQRAVEKILKEKIDAVAGAEYASAVVMDPNTGRIYAMANLPGYNPESYWQVKDAAVFRNKVLEDPYEPASVCKTFVFAGGIEMGAIRPGDKYTNTGTTRVGNVTIENAYKGMTGVISFQDAINFSLNTGSVEVLRRYDGGKLTKAGREKLYDVYFNKFGLGQATGIEFYESKGTVVKPDEGPGLNVRYANMTFGQGLDVTMMQVAAAFSAVINGGEYYAPQLVAGEVVDEKLVAKAQAPRIRESISRETSATMRDMLVQARKMSYASRSDLAGYAIGGKSGTAETIDDASGGYTKSTTIASYIGFGGETQDLPEYVVMVRIGGEGANLQGSSDAAPIFTEISNYMLEYLKIRPAN